MATRKVWDKGDWQAHFDERAGIREYDGGMKRHEAEAKAFGDCILEWLSKNPDKPARPAAGSFEAEICMICGTGPTHMSPVLPYGHKDIGHAWVHTGDCHRQYAERRRRDAITALNGFGIATPKDFNGRSISEP